MPRTIQIRNVPDGLHRTLKARAALAGMSLSDFLLAEIRALADRPTLADYEIACATVYGSHPQPPLQTLCVLRGILEVLDAPLLTCDSRIASASGHHAILSFCQT